MKDLIEELRQLDIKLWRDGDNLRFNAPAGALTPELRARLIAHKAELLSHCSDAPLAATTIPRADRGARLPLSFAQERLWVLERLEPGLAAYNMPQCWRITGPLDLAALERSLREIECRHEILRTTFSAGEDAAPAQIIHPAGALTMRVIAGERGAFPQILAAEVSQPFDLASGPLWRAAVVRLGADEHALIITWHHIVFDGWAAAIFAKELTVLYAAFQSGQPSPLPDLQIQYADYASWQHGKCTEAVMSAQLSFWRERLGGDRAPLPIPADHPRPARQSHRGGMRMRDLPATLAARLRDLARTEGVTLFVLALTAFKALLARYSGESDICIGSPITQRPDAESERLIGFFVNMLALRSDLSGDPAFRELLRRVRSTTLDAFRHQDVPFEKIVGELHPSRDLSHQPIFQIAFVLLPNETTAPAFAGATVLAETVPVTTAKFDLTLFIEETGDGMRAIMEFSADQFDGTTADRMLESLELLLEAASADPSTRLSRLPIVGPAQKERILTEWSGSERAYPHGQTIAERFAECVAQAPAAIAVVEGSERLTYAQLDARANRVAHFLQSRGVRAGDFVGLRAERSLTFVVEALGIAKAGAAYIPLDEQEPAARLATMKAACKFVLEFEPDSDAPAESVAFAARSDGPAYVLFTSGSTGVPKGVVVPHCGIMRLVVNNDYAPFRADDVVAFESNVCFDAATFEIWGALLNGATLIVTPRDTLLSPDALAQHIARHRISVMFLTTSLFNRLAQESPGMFAKLRMLVFGGEAADAASVRLVLEHGRPQRLVNGYGPTETTTFAICHTIENVTGATVPIGRPIANTRVFILDRVMQPVPQGVAGEIFIGGPGVSLGYHGAPEFTAEKFMQTEFGRLYRTGDLARWLADGTIEYLGRLDAQVKMRGFRIEPGEIESALQSHPGVRQAAVVARTESGRAQALIAYVVPQPGARAEDSALREFLSQRLPAYMVPSAFVRMDALPLTPNGKLDTRSLPQPEATQTSRAESGPPSNDTERRIAEIWGRVLGRTAPSVLDDFFTSGGHSLLALRMLAEIRKTLGVEIPARRLFETPTIEGLAAFIASSATASATAWNFLVQVQRGDAARRPFFLVPGGWGGEIEFLVYGELSRLMDPAQPVWGLKARGAGTGGAPHASVTGMAADYIREMRQVQPHGPYLLAGECVGGICAHEMACQLEEAGENVALLVLLDTVVPAQDHLINYLAAESRKRDSEARQFTFGSRLRTHLARMSGLSFGQKCAYIFNSGRRSQAARQTQPAQDSAPVVHEHPRGQKDYPVTLLRHRLGKFSGRIALVLDDESAREPGMAGWADGTHGSVDLHILPGTHLTYIRENNALAAAKFRELITQASAAFQYAPDTA